MIDPDLELVVAGSSHADMPTFGSWERTVLRHTAELVDHISLHAYYQELHGDTDSYLASGAALDRYIRTTAGVIDETLAELGLDKKIGISVDEWNVWDLRRWNEVDQAKLAEGGWKQHPRIIEDTYTVTDAVVVGSLLSSLLRNVDRVTMANQAQLVNVIAPIRSEPGGPAWRQTTFHPFQRVAALAGGASLRLAVEGKRLRTAQHGEVDLVDAAATVEESGRGAVFLTNRATASPTEVRIRLRGARFGVYAAETLTTPDGETRHAVNTADSQPVRPVPLPGAAATSDPGGTTITVTLPPLSWSVLQLAPQAGPHA
jgi:alpha-N-arabinofuranosidase